MDHADVCRAGADIFYRQHMFRSRSARQVGGGNRPRKTGPPHGGPAVCSRVGSCKEVLALLRGNYAERSGEVIVGACGKEELIGGAVLSRAVTKFEGPELVDADHDAIRIL